MTSSHHYFLISERFDFFRDMWQASRFNPTYGNLLTMANDIELKKVKTTIYMTKEDDDLLNEVFIKRLRQRKKTDRSALLCEGIRLLYEKEYNKIEEQEELKRDN